MACVRRFDRDGHGECGEDGQRIGAPAVAVDNRRNRRAGAARWAEAGGGTPPSVPHGATARGIDMPDRGSPGRRPGVGTRIRLTAGAGRSHLVEDVAAHPRLARLPPAT
jgi:hypothetical protein